MARNRQRAKQRQQQRREERLRERRDQTDGKADGDDPAEVGQVAGETGAPPENLGRSDATIEADASARRELSQEEEDELFLDEEDFEVDEEELAEAEEEYAPRGRRGGEAVAGPRGA